MAQAFKAFLLTEGAALIARYKLTHSPAAVAALADDALLEEIGRKRGAMMAGGRVNIHAANRVLHYRGRSREALMMSMLGIDKLKKVTTDS